MWYSGPNPSVLLTANAGCSTEVVHFRGLIYWYAVNKPLWWIAIHTQ